MKRSISSKMLFILAISLFIYSIPKKYGIDKEIKPYIDNVYELSKKNLDGRNLHVNFLDLKDGVMGVCYFFKNEIHINKKIWNRLGKNDRILLIAHEVAHCAKGIDHINETDELGCGKHFMHFQDTGKWCNKLKFKEYIKQMKEI